jgi:citrate/tricarballylate utilization protein
MTKRRSFADADLDYLANLCHNCNACYHACQYAPPHEFNVNVPLALAELRANTYERFAWPESFARLYERNGVTIAVATALALTIVVGSLLAIQDMSAITERHTGPGAFYAVISHGVMVTLAGAPFLFSIAAIGIGLARFSRSIGLAPLSSKHFARTLTDVATLRYLGGHEDEGCNVEDSAFSNRRRIYHQFTMWGFALCFASTCVAFVYDYAFGIVAPYPLFSLPVVLGTVGGFGLTVGCAGLFAMKRRMEPAARPVSQLGADYAFIILLGSVAVTGLALLAARDTAGMGLLLAVHLGCVLAFFLLMPFSKFVHAGYRFIALLKYAQETEEVPEQ